MHSLCHHGRGEVYSKYWSDKLRIVNAFENGAWIDAAEAGNPSDFHMISDRQCITSHYPLGEGRVLVGLAAGSGQRACVLEYDLKNRKIIAKSRVLNAPIKILKSPNKSKYIIAHKDWFTLLSSDGLQPISTFVGAKQINNDLCHLIEYDPNQELQIHRLRTENVENARLLCPNPKGLHWLKDGTLRNLHVRQTAFTNEPEHFATFVTDVTVEDFDFEAKTVCRRNLVKRYAYDQEILGYREVISTSPCGTYALLRHHTDRNDMSAESNGQSLFARLLGKFRSAAPDSGSSYVELWNLDEAALVSRIEVARVSHEKLKTFFKRHWSKPARVVYKYHDPVAPILIADSKDASNRRHPPDTTWRYLMSLPAAAAWKDNGFALLFQNAFLRQFDFDGTAGPMIEIERFPQLDVNEDKVYGLRLGLNLEFVGPSTIRTSNTEARFDLELPPPDDVQSIKPSVHFDAASWHDNINTARKLAAKTRPANAKIRSKKPEAIVAGLQKMAAIVRDRYDAVVYDDVWAPTLRYRDEFLGEEQFCGILLQHPETPDASSALDDLISSFLKNCGEPMTVYDHFSEKYALSECVVTSIILNGRVSDTCMEWVRRRDEGHEFEFGHILTERVLPSFTPATESILRLVVLLGVQDALGQQPEAQYEDPKHGRSFMEISAMAWAATALEAGDLSPDALAKVILEESRSHFGRYESHRLPSDTCDDFIKRIAGNLNLASPAESLLAKALMA